MGFNLPRQPNPLGVALGGITQAMNQFGTEERENRQIGNAFQNIKSGNKSSLEILQELGNLNVSKDKKEFLFEGWKHHTEEKKREAELAKEQIKLTRERNANRQSARALGLPEEEFADVKPSEQAAIVRAQNPSGSATSRPIPPEIANKMEKIVNENPRANADQLKVALDKAGIPPIFTSPFIENRRRQNETREKSGSKRADEFLGEVDQLESQIPVQNASLGAMEDALMTNDLSFWSPNGLAEATGAEWLGNAARGQYKTGGKTYFISNVQKFGARPNQYVEQQVVDMLPKIGRTRAGNLAGLQLFKFERDLNEEKIRYTRELEEQYEEENGVIPGKIVRDVGKHMSKFAANRQKELGETFNNIQKYEDAIDAMPVGKIFMIHPNGEPLFVSKDEIEYAISHGARPL